MAQKPPPAFYRVQHDKSFTIYEDGHGFESNARYQMNDNHWVNKEKFESHLNWKARPSEHTPYISLFDNLDDAIKRVQFHVNKGCRGVFIAKIEPKMLLKREWIIRFGNEVVFLPVWEWEAVVEDGFIATSAIRTHLRVDFRISQESEWFAVNYIPSDMIKIIWKP